MSLKNNLFKTALALFSFIVIGAKAMANYELKVIVKFPFMSSYIDSIGNLVEDSLVRNREFRVILYNSDKSDSLSNEQITNDSGFAIFDFDYWHDDSPVEGSNIRRIDIDFPNSYKYLKIGEKYQFEPLRLDSVPFTGQSPEEIIVVLPMSIHQTEYTIGGGLYSFDFAVMVDIHVADGKKQINGKNDFGTEGYDDMDDDPMETYPSTDNCEAICDRIAELLREGKPIKFVVCDGDMTVVLSRQNIKE